VRCVSSDANLKQTLQLLPAFSKMQQQRQPPFNRTGSQPIQRGGLQRPVPQQPMQPQQSHPPHPPHPPHQAETPSSGEARPRAPVPEPIQPEQVGLSTENRERIRRFLALDDEIAQLNSQLKQKREERATLKDVVTEILQPLGAPVKSGNSVLRVKKTVKREALNKTSWERHLAQSGYLKDSNKAKELVAKIYKDREAHDEYELVREK
jgi:hypothetical protein